MLERTDIPGWSDLVEWFGFEPTFHDAEVVSIDFRRSPQPSTISVYAWRMTSEVDDRGYYVLDRHTTVNFILEGVQVEAFEGWNHQNALSEIIIRRVPSSTSVSPRFKIDLMSSYGLDASFTADLLVLELQPGRIDRTIPGIHQSQPRAL